MEQKAGEFVSWNLRLLEAFFSPASRGDEAWLQVSPAELDSLAPDLGGDEGFCRAVRQGAPWSPTQHDSGQAFERRARLLAEQRRQPSRRPTTYDDPGQASSVYQGRNAPTYLPYLAALVRSAAVAQQGFYAHLREAMGLPAGWNWEEMASLECVWQDLADWTEQCNGEFGFFKMRVLGGYKHIGVPRSQSIVSSRDSDLAGRVFAQVGLRPGQKLNAVQLEEIRAQASSLSFLSAGFREALADPGYCDPIDARLEALFGDWDGSVPSLGAADASGARTVGQAETDQDVELCLGLQEDNGLPWQVHWRVPAVRDSGEVQLLHGDAQWSARLLGTEGATTNHGDCGQAAVDCLARSGHADVEFDMRLVQEEAEPMALGTLVLPRRILRVLVWAYDSLAERHELREHPLPLNGPAYLLAPPHNATRLLGYLEREGLSHEIVPADGLPVGWAMACLTDCSTLTEDQRATLPDGAAERPAPRMIRFAGGRSVSRAGMRQYLAYDLPVLELDAPAGTRIQAEGLVLVEEPFTPRLTGTGAPLGTRTAIRRFRIRLAATSLRSFTLRAIQGRQPLAESRLRVASDGGTAVAPGRLFALDPMGRPAPDGRGLRGVIAGLDPCSSAGAPFVVKREDLGSAGDALHVARTRASAAACFLDSLAQAGTLAFGAARDQLVRLISETGARVAPEHLLLQLRSRGHLELEVDHKGRLVRAHAVPPGLYELSLTVGGRRVVGVLGTLRLHCWESLLGPAGRVVAICRDDDSRLLNVWRLTFDDDKQARAFAHEQGFEWHAAPSLAITRWAPSQDQVRQMISGWAVESLGAVGGRAMRFNPTTGRFFHSSGGLAVEGDVACQLFKTEDLETRRHDVYALGLVRPGRGACFAFVRDSRWGVWLALTSFGEFVRRHYNLEEASPWPLPYSISSGTLWVPARAGVPTILERALVTCGGDAPEVVDATGEPAVNGVRLRHGRASLGFPLVSSVYTDMATGRWLAYRWVPREVAEMVAAKLGAALVDA